MFEHKELQLLEFIVKEQRKTYNLINDRFPIMHIKFHNKATHVYHYHKHEGKLDMDLNLVLSPTAGALGTPVETKADGTPFVFDPTQIQWSVQDPTIVSFVQNADGTAQFKTLAVGSTQVGVVDKATNASKTVTATVSAGAVQNTMDITFTNVTA